jgi:hypothetical protein
LTKDRSRSGSRTLSRVHRLPRPRLGEPASSRRCMSPALLTDPAVVESPRLCLQRSSGRRARAAGAQWSSIGGHNVVAKGSQRPFVRYAWPDRKVRAAITKALMSSAERHDSPSTRPTTDSSTPLSALTARATTRDPPSAASATAVLRLRRRTARPPRGRPQPSSVPGPSAGGPCTSRPRRPCSCSSLRGGGHWQRRRQAPGARRGAPAGPSRRAARARRGHLHRHRPTSRCCLHAARLRATAPGALQLRRRLTRLAVRRGERGEQGPGRAVRLARGRVGHMVGF